MARRLRTALASTAASVCTTGVAGWFRSQVFPHAACVVTLVDRLIHRAQVVEIEADSYRLKEAKELNAARSRHRRGKKS